MKIFNDFELKPINILKFIGIVLVSIVIISIISSSFNALFPRFNINSLISQSVPGADKSYEDSGVAYGGGGGYSTSFSSSYIINGNTTGDTAEEFEVTEYGVNIKTSHLESMCGKIVDLKSRDDVIFENANEYKKSCYYTFKVKRDNVSEILTILEELKPEEISESTYTIKRLVDSYVNEIDVLKEKMASIEYLLIDATSAYEYVSGLATQNNDVESLAKIIDSKIDVIEKLTQEIIDVNAQIERLEQSKAEQLDRLNYTYFNVSVLEDKFIDIQNLKDSWKTAIKSFFSDINEVAQDVTINLITLLFLVFQYSIYAFILLIVAKYGWQLIKYVWKK